MRFAVGLPNIRKYADAHLLAELAADAERADWDGLFIWDHLIYRDARDMLIDPWIALTAIALATSKIRVGVLMAGLPRRRPQIVARQAATIDRLCGGRLVFGAALGSMPEEYSKFGEETNVRIRAEKLDEGLTTIAGLWSGEPFSYRGKHVTVDDVVMLPTPTQRPRPPIWVGGAWPNRAPFRRAARWDGVMPIRAGYEHGRTMSAEELASVVTYVADHRDADEPFDVALEGESTAWRDVEPYAEVGLTWWVEKLGWWRGDVAATRHRISDGPPRAADAAAL